MKDDTLPPPDAIVYVSESPTGENAIRLEYTADTVLRLIAEAVAAEREACIRICEDEASKPYWASANDCAARIRARSDA